MYKENQGKYKAKRPLSVVKEETTKKTNPGTEITPRKKARKSEMKACRAKRKKQNKNSVHSQQNISNKGKRKIKLQFKFMRNLQHMLKFQLKTKFIE